MVWCHARKRNHECHLHCETKDGEALSQVYLAFVDLEKAYDRVPSEVMRWAIGK